MSEKCCGGHDHDHCENHGKHEHKHGECEGHGHHGHGHGECEGHGHHGHCGEHDHDHGGDCGCGEEMHMITLTLDDDTEMECGVIGMFDIEENSYIALLADDEEVLLYRFEEVDEESIDLINIDDDAEFEEVSKVFYELFEEGFED